MKIIMLDGSFSGDTRIYCPRKAIQCYIIAYFVYSPETGISLNRGNYR